MLNIDIDIERMIDLVEEENDACADYYIKSKKLYKDLDWSNRDELKERKERLDYAYQRHNSSQDAVQAVIEVFNMDKEQVARLYIAARAARRWRESTNWEKLIPEGTCGQIGRFVFGPLKAPSYACKHCGFWEAAI